MDELTAWLRHQWDTDEQWAQATLEESVTQGSQADSGASAKTAREAEETLARIEAERRILQEYETALAQHTRDAGTGGQEPETGRARIVTLECILRHLVTGYRNRDGYREAWGVGD